MPSPMNACRGGERFFRLRGGRGFGRVGGVMAAKRDILAHAMRLATCALMLAAAGVARSGAIGGRPVAKPRTGNAAGAVRTGPDGVRVADSSGLEVGVTGYGGAVPVVVTVRDGRVESVAPVLPNQETSLFFGLLDEAGLWHSWDAMTLEEAAAVEVDAVASATYSSRAAIANVKAALGALGEGTAEGKKGGGADWAPSAATVAALAVLVAAAVLPLFPRTRGKGWRTALLVLDVAVLGVWNGLFLSLDRLLGWAASGLPGTPADAAAALLLLAMGFLYPLAGKSSHYCLHVCPFGACQELAARLPVKRVAVPPGVARALSWARRGLWAGIMLSLWCALAAPWTGWELFGAFAWRAVPPLVAALAVGAVAVSAFVPRAYCRFACPTGTLLKIAESRE